ncbi:hypothetical protein GH714_000750 [Hevea brasiliensis]|uniref:Uncharacterized protein n=1 Tax=Hevea brasiliensis TaxID=3981 RepID=A0A6A6KZB1_HEVBR|nr:hypothetical protein GH714_000750 [Hevea brasiliensis]
MAEAVLFNIANEIFKKLKSQALIEIRWWWNLEDDLEKLKNTVSTIQAVLLDAEKQYSQNRQVKVWLQRLKEAIYNGDGLLDDFATDGLSEQAMSEYKNSAKGHMPLGIREMTRLEKLYSFVAAENGPSLEPVVGLGELNGLNNMRGELIIRNFRYVIKDGVSEFHAANLEEKQYLQSLRLKWVIDPFSEPYSGATFDLLWIMMILL